MEDYQKLLEQTLKEEKFYRFPSFSQDHIWELGQDLVASTEDFDGPLAVEIDLAGVMVFRYYPAGTGRYHEKWLSMKRNTVTVLEKSSLRVYAELGVNSQELEKDLFLDPQKYAACGGGFPLRLQNGCIIGFAGASGLAHTQDHAAVIGGLDRYFRRNFKELYQKNTSE